MKKIFILMSLIICFMIKADEFSFKEDGFGHGFVYETEYYKEQHKMEELLDAIRKVESQNGKYLTGKNKEFGPYQMKNIVIDDVNRILCKNIYEYKDAMNEEKSREICRFYIDYWAGKAGLRGNIEAMARIWNGGPKGYKKESTIKYWNKIKEALDVND